MIDLMLFYHTVQIHASNYPILRQKLIDLIVLYYTVQINVSI